MKSLKFDNGNCLTETHNIRIDKTQMYITYLGEKNDLYKERKTN